MTKRVVITGLGVISSIGIGWEEFWDGLLKGKSGISPVTAFDTTNHFTHNGGEVKGFRPEDFLSRERINSLSRASQMAVAAAKLGIEDAHLTSADLMTSKTATCVGVTTGPVQVIEHINDRIIKDAPLTDELARQLPVNSASASISRELGLTGPSFVFSTACAAGNYSIGYGFDLIRLQRADIVLAGAADAFSRIAFTGFNQFSAVAPDKCRPFDKNRKGMMVAEGAGIVVLESLESAAKRKAPIYAEIMGYGLSCDAHHMTSASVEGITSCMRNAMRQVNITMDEIDYISAHGTGTIANDRAESAAMREVFGVRYKEIPISSIKSMLGHTMGAASAIETIACALAVKKDIVPPTINFETPDPECDVDCVPNIARDHNVTVALNNSYAFGGNNACLVVKKI
jgi:3-oxoacyl-[acyl-carrier-protein] synthase II